MYFDTAYQQWYKHWTRKYQSLSIDQGWRQTWGIYYDTFESFCFFLFILNKSLNSSHTDLGQMPLTICEILGKWLKPVSVSSWEKVNSNWQWWWMMVTTLLPLLKMSFYSFFVLPHTVLENIFLPWIISALWIITCWIENPLLQHT